PAGAAIAAGSADGPVADHDTVGDGGRGIQCERGAGGSDRTADASTPEIADTAAAAPGLVVDKGTAADVEDGTAVGGGASKGDAPLKEPVAAASPVALEGAAGDGDD